MNITRKPFARYEEKEIDLYTLSNDNGMRVEIINYGGIIVSIETPDKEGRIADVTLGYDRFEDYLERSPYFGALIGRFGNRLADASFTLNGKLWQLSKNEGRNQLHGGPHGFDKKVWQASIQENPKGLKLTYTSPDGEEGYPGTLEATVVYSLSDDNGLKIEYTAVSDKDTIINLTNHAYFNLAGHESGTIYKQKVWINADNFTPTDEEWLPTGEIRPVAGTPFDFLSPKEVGEGLLNCMDDPQMQIGKGYDHNYVLNTKGNLEEKAAEVYDPESGRVMTVYTTKPGIQLYTGNHLRSAGKGKGGAPYTTHHGLCLETQYFPNAMQHAHFPSPILKAGEVYKHTTIYKFGVR